MRWSELCVIMCYLLEAAISRWEHCDHNGVDMVRNNAQVGCGVWMMPSWYKGAKKMCQGNMTPPAAA